MKKTIIASVLFAAFAAPVMAQSAAPLRERRPRRNTP